MKSIFTKPNLLLVALIAILLIPTLGLIHASVDSVVASFTKKIVYFLFASLFITSPLTLIKPKHYFAFGFLILLFSVGELIHLNIFGSFSSTGIIYTSLETNKNEAFELLGSNIPVLLFFALYSLLYFLCWYQLPKSTTINKKIKTILFSAFILLNLALYTRDYKVINGLFKAYSVPKKLAGAKDLYMVKLKKTYPIGTIIKLIDVLGSKKEAEQYLKQVKDFTYQAKTTEDTATVILIIGETARYDRWSLNGYKKSTSPNLDTTRNLISFKNVASAANLTHISLPYLLTPATPTNDSIYHYKSIVKAFKEAGYSTTWISNQPYGAFALTAHYMRESDQYFTLNDSFEKVNQYDENCFPQIKQALNSPESKKLIIIHTIGSHYRYNYRYPKTFDKFQPSTQGSPSIDVDDKDYKIEVNNAYDNSILYTDHFISQVIKFASNQKSCLFYVSDHGENLIDNHHNLIMHGAITPTKEELHVPLFLWFSNSFIQSDSSYFKNALINQAKEISSADIMHSILDLGKITTPYLIQRKSFVNDKCLSNHTRKVKSVEGKVFTIDSTFNLLEE